MNTSITGLVERPELRDRIRVFKDREEAGRVLSEMLTEFRDSDSVVLAIPSGGVPVGIVLAQNLHLKLDVAVTSKGNHSLEPGGRIWSGGLRWYRGP